MPHDHSHSHESSGNLKTAFFLNLAFTVIEIIGGLWTNSIASNSPMSPSTRKSPASVALAPINPT